MDVGAGRYEASWSIQGWARPAKMCRFYPQAGEGIGEIQDAYLEDPYGGRVEEGSVQGE